jgi:cytochrome b561
MKSSWGAVMQVLHWLVVLAVLCQLTLGFVVGSLSSEAPLWAQLFPLHTVGSIGSASEDMPDQGKVLHDRHCLR